MSDKDGCLGKWDKKEGVEKWIITPKKQQNLKEHIKER